jgi:hypothetical protein
LFSETVGRCTSSTGWGIRKKTRTRLSLGNCVGATRSFDEGVEELAVVAVGGRPDLPSPPQAAIVAPAAMRTTEARREMFLCICAFQSEGFDGRWAVETGSRLDRLPKMLPYK